MEYPHLPAPVTPFYGMYPPSLPTSPLIPNGIPVGAAAAAAVGVANIANTKSVTSLASSPLSSIKRPSPAASTPPSPTMTCHDKSSSSFAAALRNLAKNASSVANDLPQSSSMISAANAAMVEAAASPIAASTTAAIAPTSTGAAAPLLPALAPPPPPEPPALLDVRRGFDRSNDSTAANNKSAPSSGANNASIATQSSKTSAIASSSSSSSVAKLSPEMASGSGFQPYRPQENHSSVSAAAAAMSLPYTALAYGYHHPTFFPSPHLTSPYGLEAEAYYRAHLERYASIARSSLISPHYVAANPLMFPPPSAVATPTPPSAQATDISNLNFSPVMPTTSIELPTTSIVSSTLSSSGESRKRRRSSSRESKSPKLIKSSGEIQNTTNNIMTDNPLRPPPSLTTPPVLPPTTLDFRLPTQPLDIASVKNLANKMTANIAADKNSSSTTSLLRGIRAKAVKKPFVRPFEDDYGLTTYSTNNQEIENKSQDSKTQQIDKEMKAILNNNNNIVIPKDVQMEENEPKIIESAKKETIKSENISDEAHPIVSKEKLKYLRYFRLVTHRKRNSTDSAEMTSLEKRHFKMMKKKHQRSQFKSEMEPLRPASPTLPLPSRTGKLPPDSNAKLMFFTMLGLLKLGETDKKEHEMIWGVVLEDRLARKCQSTTMSYLMKLRGWNDHQDSKRQYDSSDIFLNYDEIIHSSQKTSSSKHSLNSNLSPPSKSPNANYVVSTPNQSPQSRPLLPINLSTLLPVSKTSLQDVVTTTEIQPPSWLQSGSLNIPALVCSTATADNISSSSSLTSSLISNDLETAFNWPGVETIIESYKKHHQAVSEQLAQLHELNSKQQLEISNKRSLIDSLSSQMAALVRHQKELRSKQLNMNDAINNITETLVTMSKL